MQVGYGILGIGQVVVKHECNSSIGSIYFSPVSNLYQLTIRARLTLPADWEVKVLNVTVLAEDLVEMVLVNGFCQTLHDDLYPAC